MLSAREAAAKWLNRATTAGDSIRAGVNAMTEADNPLTKAAAREQQWAEGCARAAQQRKFSAGLNRVTFAEWKNAMLTKGITNYATGLRAGQPKMQAFLDRFLPYVQEGRDRLRQTPRGTLQQNMERMRIMVEHLAAYRARAAYNEITGPDGLFR